MAPSTSGGRGYIRRAPWRRRRWRRTRATIELLPAASCTQHYRRVRARGRSRSAGGSRSAIRGTPIHRARTEPKVPFKGKAQNEFGGSAQNKFGGSAQNRYRSKKAFKEPDRQSLLHYFQRRQVQSTPSQTTTTNFSNMALSKTLSPR